MDKSLKKITVKWKLPKDKYSLYKEEMRVISSNHERFKKGTRFDFGFLTIASKEGFIIEVLPLE